MLPRYKVHLTCGERGPPCLFPRLLPGVEMPVTPSESAGEPSLVSAASPVSLGASWEDGKAAKALGRGR